MREKRDIVITFGTFDLFHIGHLNILRRARSLGGKLIVGVSTDNLNFCKKKEYPTYNQNDRLEIVGALSVVDEVFFEESLEDKRKYIEKYKANILVMGDDWQGKFDEYSDICSVKYFKRTELVSSSGIKRMIFDQFSRNV